MVRVNRVSFSTYSAAILAVVAALLISWLLWPLASRYRFMFFWPMIFLVTWHFGLRGGLAAIFLSAFTNAMIYQLGAFQFSSDSIDLAAIAVFILLASPMCWFIAQTRVQERLLRESDRRFRLMVENTPCCVWTAAPDGTITYTNRYWYEFTGLTPEQTRGSEWVSVVHPDDRQKTLDAWLSAARTGQPYELTVRNRRADGEWRLLYNCAVPVYDAQGQITDWYGTSMDITDLKAAQTALNTERELFQKLIDTIPVMITMYRPDTKIMRVNPEFERVTGWSNAEIQGMSLMEEIYPDATYREEVAAFMASGYAGWGDIEMTTRDGGIIQSSWANIRLTDDTRIGIGIDITRRKIGEIRTKTLQTITTGLSRPVTKSEIASVIIDLAIEVFGAAGGALVVLTDDDTMLEIVDPVGYSKEITASWERFSVDHPSAPLATAVRTKEPVWIKSTEQLLAEYPIAPDTPGIRKHEGRAALPLIIRNKVIGAIALSFRQPQLFEEDQRYFLMVFAQQCAQVLERVQLYEHAQTAQAKAEFHANRLIRLQQLTSQLSPAVMKDQVTAIITESSFKLVGADVGSIWELTADGAVLELIGHHNAPAANVSRHRRVLIDVPMPVTDVIRLGGELWLTLEQFMSRYPHLVSTNAPIAEIKAWAVVPLSGYRRVFGVMVFSFFTPKAFDDEEKDFIRAVAHQSAQALERAQLFEQAKAVAAEEERKRLARDLHDSVTQTLFAATTIAESLTRLWQRNPDRAVSLVEQIHTLNRAATAEMRVLLSELRPELIARTSFKDLCQQLASAARGRKEIKVTVDLRLEDAQALPRDVHVALYRIVQEALNNVLKHAQAQQVTISLCEAEGVVMLEIADDGRGFDAEHILSGMGMGSMRERAENINASIEIISSAGNGTRVLVRWERTLTPDSIPT